jgi:LysR family transcriptional regulator, transcriptional activator of the cysJI operon
MKIENLEVFCLVVEEGSINKAAKKKFLSQPAVSKQIHLLEENYESLLFERNNGKLILTESGKALYPIAKKIVNDYHQSLAIVSQTKNKMKLVLNIGASLTIGEYLLPKILGDFKKNFPQIEITLKIGSTPNILNHLEKDQIQIALVEGEVKGDNFKVKKFAQDEPMVVFAANHRWKESRNVPLREVITEKLIWREENSGIRMLVEEILKQNKINDQLNVYMEFGSTQAIKGAVEENLGISILSKLAIEKEIKEGSLKALPIEGIDFKRNLWVVQKKDYIVQESVKIFRNFLLQRT